MAAEREDFDTGTSGNNIPTNGTFGIIDGGSNGASSTFNFANDQSVTGSISAKCVAAASTQRYATVTSQATGHFSAFFRYTATDATQNTILQLRSGTTIRAQVIMLAGAATLRVQNGTSSTGGTSSALSVDTWYRLDWHITSSGATGQSLDVFTGANLHGTVADFSIAATTYNSGTFDRFYIGFANTPTASRTGWWDSMAWDDTNAIGSPFKTGTGSASFTVTTGSTGAKNGRGTSSAAFTVTTASTGRKNGQGTTAAAFTSSAASAGAKGALSTGALSFTLTAGSSGTKTSDGPTPVAGSDWRLIHPPRRPRTTPAEPRKPAPRVITRGGTGTARHVLVATSTGHRHANAGRASAHLPLFVAVSTGRGNQVERRRKQELELLTL